MSKPTIYQQHDAAFALVSAFVIMRGDERIGTVAFKFPRGGDGRVYAYVHFIGMEMVRGFAGGGGYDRQTAAVENAVKRIDPANLDAYHADGARTECARFIAAVNDAKDGTDWNVMFRDAGYNVFKAV